MTQVIEIKVPDIGDFKDVAVIELLVKPGDAVEKETSLVTLETDKAAMEVPSPQAGVVKDIRVKVGDTVSEGSLLLTLELAAVPGETDKRAGSSEAEPGPPERVQPRSTVPHQRPLHAPRAVDTRRR